jgi:ABC-type spermidine/putrescine transport systems, ATPase components
MATQERQAKLVLHNLTKKYKNGDGVEQINMHVETGELVTMLGPSGCGKTTILRLIGGFLLPDDGEILLDGGDISRIPPEKRPTAMVFQSYNLWPHMTVFDNLAFGLKLRKIPKRQIQEQVQKALQIVRMEGVEKKYPSQLSGGQQQRIAIARALLLKPALLLLDEPFSALDAKIRAQMREEIGRIQRETDATIVFVTHDQEEAMAISHRIIVMNKGVIEQIGTSEEIYDNPDTIFVARFIGNMNFIKQAGSDQMMAVRPENIIPVSEEAADLTGQIVSISILGHFLEMKVETEKGTLRSYITRTDSISYKNGDHIGIKIGKHKTFKGSGQ